jgi:hypothetical protein
MYCLVCHKHRRVIVLKVRSDAKAIGYWLKCGHMRERMLDEL